eukprot:GEMP01073592.1.p1 GENE.GEMP01073592.1~~GEMP01073592.1.p1  ORF type:complete len:217 (+),score=36.94 GEMP01073592.1:141-791(+)
MSLYSVEIGIYRLSDATVLLALQALQSNVYDRVTKGFASNSLFMTAGRQVQHAKLLEAQFPADEVLDLFYNFPIEDIEQTPWKAVCPLPQLFDFLRKEWGVKIGILTNDSRKNAKSFLQSQGVQVDAMVCTNEGFADKPDPAGLASILKELGVAKEKAVMVGDVRIDMAVGVNAGCVARVGVLSGMDDEKALREAGATIVLPDVSHLMDGARCSAV